MPEWTEDGYQRILDAASRGRQTLIDQAKKEYALKLADYNKNPSLCLCCTKPLLFEKFTNKAKYCSRSCAAKINNKKRKKQGAVLNCLNCNVKINDLKSFKIKYCSIKCSAQHKSNKLMQDWLEGKKSPAPKALRTYLKKLKPLICEICKHAEWNNQPIPLEMDHKDGNHKNNNFENLRLICPNCHAQTPTYKSKNKGNGRDYRRERWRVGKTC